jgi:5'-nucleotidase
LHILAAELRKFAKVVVVAPLEEKSTTGHSLTLHKPLRLIEIAKDVYGVSGSPADCVYVGIRKVLKSKPDLIVSGPNRGANLGQDVYYSGTVSAAREACMMGISSLAVSLCIDFNKSHKDSALNYLSAARWTSRLIKDFKDLELPHHTMLNLNVPDLPFKKIRGLVLARQGFRHYSGDVVERTDHRGKPYYWVGGQYQGFKKDPGTDCDVVERGYASLTPIKLDATDSVYLAQLSKRFDLPPMQNSRSKR